MSSASCRVTRSRGTRSRPSSVRGLISARITARLYTPCTGSPSGAGTAVNSVRRQTLYDPAHSGLLTGNRLAPEARNALIPGDGATGDQAPHNRLVRQRLLYGTRKPMSD